MQSGFYPIKYIGIGHVIVWDKKFQTFSNSNDHSWDQCKSEENIFFEGEGVGLLEYSDPTWHWNAPFATPEAKEFLGEDPQNL